MFKPGQFTSTIEDPTSNKELDENLKHAILCWAVATRADGSAARRSATTARELAQGDADTLRFRGVGTD